MADIWSLLQSYQGPHCVHEEAYTYCPLCGGRFAGSFIDETPSWISDAVAMTTTHVTASNTTELDKYHRFSYESIGNSEIRVHGMWRPIRIDSPSSIMVFDCIFKHKMKLRVNHPDNDERYISIVPMWVEMFEMWYEKPNRSDVYGEGQLFIPIHSACFDLTERFISHQTPSEQPNSYSILYGPGMFDGNRPIRSLIDLHLTFLARGDLYTYGPKEFPTHLQIEPHNYFLPEAIPFREDPAPPMQEMTDADPLETVNTSIILSNLELLPEPSSSAPDTRRGREQAQLAHLYFSLPLELRQKVEMEVFTSVDEAPLDHQSFLHQEVWRDYLVSGRTFPWLWDLDPDTVTLKEQEKPVNRQWNWELLVRQLSQPTILTIDDLPIRVPFSLRNRRRIWKILDVARIGDLAREDWDDQLAQYPVSPLTGWTEIDPYHYGWGHEECGKGLPGVDPECCNLTLPLHLEPPPT